MFHARLWVSRCLCAKDYIIITPSTDSKSFSSIDNLTRMDSSIQKSRGRGDSDPTPNMGSAPLAPSPLRGKRRRTASMEAALYDDDYKRYARHTFHPGQENEETKPWALDPPPPVSDPSQLDEKIVQHIYFYSHYRLKLRRVSPRSLPFLEKFRDAAERAMEKPTEELKIKLAAWNETLHSATILRREPSFQNKEAYKALKEITIYRYLADYGDYLAEESAAIREAALKKRAQLEGIEQVLVSGKTWQSVQQETEKEESAIAHSKSLREERRTWGHPDTPTITSIRSACYECKMGEENAFYAIRIYARGNQLMHCMIGVYIKNLEWHALARQLAKDFRDLPLAFGRKEAVFMLRVLKRVRDRFFLSIDNPDKPVLSREAIKRASQRTAKEENRRRDERLKIAAQEKRDAKTKRSKDDGSQEAQIKRRGRNERSENQEMCKEIGDILGDCRDDEGEDGEKDAIEDAWGAAEEGEGEHAKQVKEGEKGGMKAVVLAARTRHLNFTKRVPDSSAQNSL